MYKLVGDRLAGWNPGKLPESVAESEYESYLPGVYEAHARGSLHEYMCSVATDFWGGKSPQDFYDDEDTTSATRDIELLLSR